MDETMFATAPENSMAVYGFSTEEESTPTGEEEGEEEEMATITAPQRRERRKTMPEYGPHPLHDGNLVITNILLVCFVYVSFKYFRSPMQGTSI